MSTQSAETPPLREENQPRQTEHIVVAAFYKFASLIDCECHRAELRERAGNVGVRGTILLATEGINGTIAGTRAGVDEVLGRLRALPGCADLEHKEALADEMPFQRLKVKIKPEIVTMGVPGVDPNGLVGTYVAPKDWNALIAAPDVVVVDTRNAYEFAIGSFAGAIDPGTQTFRQFPDWVERAPELQAKPKVAMFCTGGIRCEKATAYLRAQGFAEVYHLAGGILKYLEEVPAGESLWRGECFVFDDRVSVDHHLAPGQHIRCRACGDPVARGDVGATMGAATTAAAVTAAESGVLPASGSADAPLCERCCS